MIKEIGRGMIRYGLIIKDVDFIYVFNDVVLYLIIVFKFYR